MLSSDTYILQVPELGQHHLTVTLTMMIFEKGAAVLLVIVVMWITRGWMLCWCSIHVDVVILMERARTTFETSYTRSVD